MKKRKLLRQVTHLGLFIAVLLSGVTVINHTPAQAAQTTPFPVPKWLTYLNIWRVKAEVPPVENHFPYSTGSFDHAVYMLNTGHLAHYERPESEWFTEEGNAAAWRSTIAASNAAHSDYLWAIDYWVSTPFNLIPILDPKLELVGYGLASREDFSGEAPGEAAEGASTTDEATPVPEEDSNQLQIAVNLDVWRGRVQEVPDSVTYPIMFPPDGGETWVIRHSLFEFPNPFSFCEDYQNPSGPGIVILLGDGSGVPTVTDHSFETADGELLESCVFHETTYTSPDEYEQISGRQILAERDAVVIMPREPLDIDASYTASVTANGETYTWTFSTIRPSEQLLELFAENE